MPISQGHMLFSLIQSLSKAEKRNFSLYIKRLQSEDEAPKFLHLFELFDKQKVLNEDEVKIKLGKLSPVKYSNLKRHLYQHLLISLRLMQVNKYAAIKTREYIDYAQVLYGKGLYLQALKILDRAKSFCKKNELEFLLLEVLEFEKLIESRHITRSNTDRIKYLQEEASQSSRITSNIVEWANIKLDVQRFFINKGHVKNKEQKAAIFDRYGQQLFNVAIEDKSFFEKVYYYQSLYWLYFIVLDIQSCHNMALKWTKLYKENPEMINDDVDIYMLGLHHLLSTSYFIGNYNTFMSKLEEMEHFRKSRYNTFNYNSKILSFLYVHQARMNKCFMDGNFEQGLEYSKSTVRRIKRYGHLLDPHKRHIFYYKIAWLYLGLNQPGKCIDYINLILNEQKSVLRGDLSAFSHMLFLMAHYELKHDLLIPHLISTTQRQLGKLKNDNPLLKTALSMFKELNKINGKSNSEILDHYKEKIELLRHNSFEKRSFIYIDIESWIDSQLEKKRMADIIKEKFHQQKHQ